MTQMNTYATGRFNWIELATRDADVAKQFYGNLFGWTFEDALAGPDRTHTLFRKGEHIVAAAHEMDAALKAQTVPSQWQSFVAVDDVDAFEAKAVACGGSVVRSAFDVADAGRMAVVTEPTGAAFSLWQGQERPGAGVQHETATLCFTELATRNADVSGKFFIQLFGWKPEPFVLGNITYIAFASGSETVAGMVPLRRSVSSTSSTSKLEPYAAPSHFVAYIEVAHCDASVARAKALGGKIVAAPQDVRGVGRFAILEDPEGARFGVLQHAAGSKVGRK